MLGRRIAMTAAVAFSPFVEKPPLPQMVFAPLRQDQILQPNLRTCAESGGKDAALSRGYNL